MKPVALQEIPTSCDDTQPKLPLVIDLFCGIGGFRIAAERAGTLCVFSCDWDRFSQLRIQLVSATHRLTAFILGNMETRSFSPNGVR